MVVVGAAVVVGAWVVVGAAVVVGGKVAGSAVARNRIRRLIFADLERRFGLWENRPVSDMVVMVMSKPEDESQLRADLERCFAKL